MQWLTSTFLGDIYRCISFRESNRAESELLAAEDSFECKCQYSEISACFSLSLARSLALSDVTGIESHNHTSPRGGEEEEGFRCRLRGANSKPQLFYSFLLVPLSLRRTPTRCVVLLLLLFCELSMASTSTKFFFVIERVNATVVKKEEEKKKKKHSGGEKKNITSEQRKNDGEQSKYSRLLLFVARFRWSIWTLDLMESEWNRSFSILESLILFSREWTMFSQPFERTPGRPANEYDRANESFETGSSSGTTYRSAMSPRVINVQRQRTPGFGGGVGVTTRMYQSIQSSGGGGGGGHFGPGLASLANFPGVPLRGSVNNNTALVGFNVNRQRDKRDLEQLNDKFAQYVEKVRFLEAQNRKLVLELEGLKGRTGQWVCNERSLPRQTRLLR